MWMLQWSPHLILALGVAHLLVFGGLYTWRNGQVLRLQAFLGNLVRGFSQSTDVGTKEIDDEIEGFLADVREVLNDPSRGADRRELHKRLEIKDESRPYLASATPSTVYNVARTFIEAYPLLGILCTILAIGFSLGQPASPVSGHPAAVTAAADPATPPPPDTSSIVRGFSMAIWSTAAGLVVAIVLMLVNALMGPGLDRLFEHRHNVRDAVFAAKKCLGAEPSAERES